MNLSKLKKDYSILRRPADRPRTLYLAAAAAMLILASGLALAQEPPKPSHEQIAEQANGLISALADQRNAAMNENAQLRAQVVKLWKELEAAKAPKSEK